VGRRVTLKWKESQRGRTYCAEEDSATLGGLVVVVLEVGRNIRLLQERVHSLGKVGGVLSHWEMGISVVPGGRRGKEATERRSRGAGTDQRTSGSREELTGSADGGESSDGHPGQTR
jgi:hypothetical protein